MSQKAGKVSNLKILKRLFSYALPYKRTLILAIPLSLILAMLSPLRPYLIQYSVDKYIRNGLLHELVVVSVWQLVILLVESGLRFGFMYQISRLGQTVVNDIRKSVFSKIVRQDIGFFDRTAIGTLTTRTINDIESINDVFSEGILSILADILTIISIMCVMFFTDWRLTLICLTTFPLLVVATWWFKEEVNKSFQRVRNAVAALNAFIQEHLTAMYIVQAFTAEKTEMARFAEINKEHRDANIKGIFAYSVFFPIVEIILALSQGLLIWYGAVRILNLQVSSGIIISFVMYLNLLFRPLRMMADKFNVLQMGIIAGERVFTLLDNTENHQFRNVPEPQQQIISSGTVSGAVTFQDVWFGYKPDVPVLKGVSFQLEAGKTMAVVGHTGAGKTSLISILNKTYEIQSGNILIDGVNINDYDIHFLRQKIGIVLQDVFLFSGSILDNITLRNDTITLEQAKSVCRLIGIHEFIMSLPGNYDFNIMERGNNISQGQKQLLSFARALIYNPSILILDEATSSVDSESEQLIQLAIDTMIKGRTSIVIAHRLSTIRKANEIIVLSKGEILERGNHENLLQKRGAYFELYTAVAEEKEGVLLI